MPHQLTYVTNGLAVTGVVIALLAELMVRNLQPGARTRSGFPPTDLLTPRGRSYRRAALLCLGIFLLLTIYGLGLIVVGDGQ